jgi:hypothetical protein
MYLVHKHVWKKPAASIWKVDEAKYCYPSTKLYGVTCNITAARTSNIIDWRSVVSFFTPTSDKERGPKGVLHTEYVHFSKAFYVLCRADVNLSQMQNYCWWWFCSRVFAVCGCGKLCRHFWDTCITSSALRRRKKYVPPKRRQRRSHPHGAKTQEQNKHELPWQPKISQNYSYRYLQTQRCKLITLSYIQSSRFNLPLFP